MIARPTAPWPSISVQSMSKRARRSTAREYRRRGREVANRALRPPAARLNVRRRSSAAGRGTAAVARAAGRLAESVEMAGVALQLLVAVGHVRAFLRMLVGARDPRRELVAVVAVREAVVLVAVAVDAAVRLDRRALRVAGLAGDLRVLAHQRLRVREVLAARPGAQVMAVLARPAVGMRRLVAVRAVLRADGVAGEGRGHGVGGGRGDARGAFMNDGRVTGDALLLGVAGAAVLERGRRRRAQRDGLAGLGAGVAAATVAGGVWDVARDQDGRLHL